MSNYVRIQHVGTELAIRDLDDMLVVRKWNYLRFLGKRPKATQSHRGSLIIEIQEDIVDNERDRIMGCEPILQAGQLQRRIQRI
jgi:hypothetical protein